jgi:putative endonuclease
MEHFTVYILFSQNADKHYTGYTSNLEQRMLSHNELGVGWTAKYRPWKLIFTKEFRIKAEAMQFEKWLKSGVGRDFIKTLKH